jgi:hypothetical protein
MTDWDTYGQPMDKAPQDGTMLRLHVSGNEVEGSYVRPLGWMLKGNLYTVQPSAWMPLAV